MKKNDIKELFHPIQRKKLIEFLNELKNKPYNKQFDMDELDEININKIIKELDTLRDKRPEPIDLVDINILRELYNKVEYFELNRLTITFFLLYVQSIRKADNVDMAIRSSYCDIQQVAEWLDEIRFKG